MGLFVGFGRLGLEGWGRDGLWGFLVGFLGWAI